MELDQEQGDDLVLLRVRSERIDAAAAIPFKEAVRGAIGDARRVVLDLTAVQFLDSSGLGAIVSIMKILGPERRLELAGLTPSVAKVFSLTRMDTVFTIHATAEDGLDGYRHAS